MEVVSLGEFAALVRQAGVASVVVHTPAVRFHSVRFPSQDCQEWVAVLTVTAEVDGLLVEVVVGGIEFVIARLGGEPVAPILELLGFPDIAAMVDNLYLREAVEEQYEDVHSLLIMERIGVSGPLQGHRLGAWTIAETIHRMHGRHGDLVIIDPTSPGTLNADPGSGSDAAPSATAGMDRRIAAARLTRYLRDTVGVVPMRGNNQLLAHSSNFIHLHEHRLALEEEMTTLAIRLTAQQINHAAETPAFPARRIRFTD